MDTALITGASRGPRPGPGAGPSPSRVWRLVLDARGADRSPPCAAELAALTEVVARRRRRRRRRPPRARWCDAADGSAASTCWSTTPACSARAPSRALADYPLDVLEHVYRGQRRRPAARWSSARCPRWRRAPIVINVTSDAAVEAYEGWGGYGSSKAALEQLTRVLAAEHPDLRVVRGRPGRHEHADAPGGVPRRGHLRPAAARGERAGPARASSTATPRAAAIRRSAVDPAA